MKRGQPFDDSALRSPKHTSPQGHDTRFHLPNDDPAGGTSFSQNLSSCSDSLAYGVHTEAGIPHPPFALTDFDKHAYGASAQHHHPGLSSPPLVPSPATPVQQGIAHFPGELTSPTRPFPPTSPSSPSAHSHSSSYAYSTPALSAGSSAMSASSSQDYSSSPGATVALPPSVRALGAFENNAGGPHGGGDYYRLDGVDLGKPPGGRVFLNPPTGSAGATQVARGGSAPASTEWNKGKEREVIVADVPLPEETRKGHELGVGLGDFDMLETLGTGTFGKVLLTRLRAKSAAHPGQTQPHYFAMKVLEKVTVVRLRQVEHVNSERGSLAHVSHPFIVNLFCTFQDERNLYLLLEYVQGGELFSHLRRAGRFSSDVARFYAANLILALEYLHSQDIIYRDLKPENLLIDSTGYLKITDFGFAKRVTDRTFKYLCPEIITATGHGRAADWWSLGILLFELMAGYPPFFADNPLEIYEKILAGKVAFPPHFDFVAKDLIKRLLMADLTKRLGNLKGGANDVKNHRWFEGVEWDAVVRKEIRAPIVPHTATPGDTSNFEQYPASPLETLPGALRAQQARQYQISPDSLERGPDPYGYLFPSF